MYGLLSAFLSFGQSGPAVLRFFRSTAFARNFLNQGTSSWLRIVRGILVLISPAIYLRKKTSLSHVISMRRILFEFFVLTCDTQSRLLSYHYLVGYCLFILFCIVCLPEWCIKLNIIPTINTISKIAECVMRGKDDLCGNTSGVHEVFGAKCTIPLFSSYFY